MLFKVENYEQLIDEKVQVITSVKYLTEYPNCVCLKNKEMRTKL